MERDGEEGDSEGWGGREREREGDGKKEKSGRGEILIKQP